MYPKPLSTGVIGAICRVPVIGFVVTVILLVSICWTGSNVPCQPNILISFTFDDGYESTYQVAFPILEKYNYTGTVYVITDLVGEPRRMDWNQLDELYNEGWEIASHTSSHSNLTELSSNDLLKELSDSRIVLELHGFDVESFAVPFGAYNDFVIKHIKMFYVSNRTVDKGLNEFPITDEQRYRLKAVELNADTTIEEVKTWMDKAAEEQKLLILVIHQLDGEGKFNYSSQDFEEIVDYAHELGLEPLNVER